MARPRRIGAKHDESGAKVSLEMVRRRQLLKATIESVAELGIEKTTMRVVADRAGVTTGMLLYYYRSRKELMNAAIALAAEDFIGGLDALTHSMFGAERLEALSEVWLREDSPDGIPRNFALHYRAAALYDDEIRQAYREIYRQARNQLAKSVHSGKQSGQLKLDLNDELAADYIHALMQGLAFEIGLNSEMISSKRAIEIARLGLHFLSVSPGTLPESKGVEGDEPEKGRDVTAQVESILASDARLSPAVARQLATSFQTLYEISVQASQPTP